MLTQERYEKILSILNEKNVVTVSELTNALDTSESTIRRDLSALAEMGRLNKVFGGATSIKQNSGITEDNVSSRENLMSKEKDLIAKYSASLIIDTDFVYIDAGTTTSKLIDYISNTKATYVTNGISHARKLIYKGLNAYIIVGKMKPVTEALKNSILPKPLWEQTELIFRRDSPHRILRKHVLKKKLSIKAI